MILKNVSGKHIKPISKTPLEKSVPKAQNYVQVGFPRK